MKQYRGNTICFGDLHTHTGYSDGKKTPWDAYRHAAKAGLLDFLAVTDHAAHSNAEKFSATLQAARECTTENFLAIAACENGFSSQYENEYGIPVINGGELITFAADHPLSESESLEDFVQDLSTRKEAFAGFAHPQEASWPTEFLWNGYDLPHHRTEEVLRFVRMIEVCNETSAYNLLHEKLYPTALDCGFRVSPIAVSDTHKANWGGKELQSRTAVLVPSLTESAVLDALRNQRCYASEAGNVLLDFAVNHTPMGGTADPAEEYRVDLWMDMPDAPVGGEFAQVEILSDYGQTLISRACQGRTLHMEETLFSKTARYFFIRVVTTHGKRIWSAPVWTGRAFDQTEALLPLRKIPKEEFRVVSSTAPKTAACLTNGNPKLPWRCSAPSGETVIDLGNVYTVCGVGYHRHHLPYEDLREIHALLHRYAYSLSLDGVHFICVAEGVIGNYGSEQIHRFAGQCARYIKVEARSSISGDAGISGCYPAIGELSIYREPERNDDSTNLEV